MPKISLKITVLPASLPKEILPEVQRLQCTRVLQIWYDHSYIQPGAISGSSSRQSVLKPEPTYEDSLFYSLWNAANQKVIGRGSVPLSWDLDTGEAPNVGAGITLAQQTLKWLNRAH